MSESWFLLSVTIVAFSSRTTRSIYRIFCSRSTANSVAPSSSSPRKSEEPSRENCWCGFITFIFSGLFLVEIHRLNNSVRLPNSRYAAYHGKGRRRCPVFVDRPSSASISLSGSPMTCTLGRYQDAIPSRLRRFVSHSNIGRKIPFRSGKSSALRKAQGARCLTKKQRVRALWDRGTASAINVRGIACIFRRASEPKEILRA